MSELTPYLCVRDARAAIDWYVETMGAEITYPPYVMPDGRIGHVELAVGGAGWMMADEFESEGVPAPDPSRGAAVTLHLKVDDVDSVARSMADGGATVVRGPADDEPAGRVAVLSDPFGHRWLLNQPSS